MKIVSHILLSILTQPWTIESRHSVHKRYFRFSKSSSPILPCKCWVSDMHTYEHDTRRYENKKLTNTVVPTAFIKDNRVFLLKQRRYIIIYLRGSGSESQEKEWKNARAHASCWISRYKEGKIMIYMLAYVCTFIYIRTTSARRRTLII